VADAVGLDPVNVLGELIEDAAHRYSGTIGTVAAAHVAEEVIERLRSDPALAAATLGAYAGRHSPMSAEEAR
jgi:NifU-like protein involved in Fe-S cluster formation